MKIFYAVQATGNGHISRATEILPHLLNYGEVDVFLSGSNYSLKTNLPVAYRSKGVSLQYAKEKGKIDLYKTITSISLRKIWNEARFLPVDKYDLVINDFECITSLACKLKKIKSIHFGHQASFISPKVPRPKKKDAVAEWIFTHYAQSNENYGIHFKAYDENIFEPIIRSSIVNSDPTDKGHITIYLGHYSSKKIMEVLKGFPECKFEIFSGDINEITTINNFKLLPINQELFSNSLLHCHGIITGAGFETPAEALYLGKKLLVIPLKGQYEQQCNAAALKDFNVTVVEDFNENFSSYFENWMNKTDQKDLTISKSTKEIVSAVIEKDKFPMFEQFPILKENIFTLDQKIFASK